MLNVNRLVLVTPHSNARIERLYALVNKNNAKGTDRNRLDIEGCFSSILPVKLAGPEDFFKCCSFKPDENLLHDAKEAKRKYNTLHSSISSNVATLP